MKTLLYSYVNFKESIIINQLLTDCYGVTAYSLSKNLDGKVFYDIYTDEKFSKSVRENLNYFITGVIRVLRK